jgi:hypothetical protein
MLAAMPPFSIVHLDERNVLDAWPVLRSTGAVVVADWWEDEVHQLMNRGGGILAARAADGSIHGVATYECVHRPRTGCVLAVGRLVTIELSRKQPVKEALCDALHVIAGAFCCSAVAMPLPAKGYLQQRTRQMIYGDASQPRV